MVVVGLVVGAFLTLCVIAALIRHHCNDYPCFDQTEQHSPDDWNNGNGHP